MVIFDGKKEAEKILFELKKKIQKEKTKLSLGVISVGENPASKLFIKNKKAAAKRIGIKIVHRRLRKEVKERELINEIKKFNSDSSINGIIVQLPLPKGFNTQRITKNIDPKKDVDGFHRKTYFLPPLVSAILIALKKAAKNPRSKKIIALVNSDIFGKALKKNIKIDYILKEKILPAKLKSADVLITVCGCPGLIKGNMIKKGVILIDAGITVIGRNKILGDVDRESIREKAVFLTPVPGGIGPLTVALLLKNVYEQSRQNRR